MTITIADQPVLVDAKGEAQAWLDRFMPESTIFRPPKVDFDQYLGGPSATGEFFKSSLPELPPIKIGQIQWPCVGASRFARGLFLVDRVALFEILNLAWDVAIPTTYPQPIPGSWVQLKNQTVPVFLASGTPDFVLHLYVLNPIPVSDDLWLLPLVDGRYYRLGQCRIVTEIIEKKPINTWENYFSGLVTFNYNVTYVVEAGILYGNPDPVLRDPQVPLPFALDAACFSVGCRPVVPMGIVANELEGSAILKVKCERPSFAEAKKVVILQQAKITGGDSGTARKPKKLRVATRLVESYYSGENRVYQYDRSIGSGEGITLYAKAVWNKHSSESDADFVEYLGSIADKIDYWNVDEYYVTLPDIVKLDPGGFDDYIIYESSGDKKTTTIRSLPIDFVAPFLLSQSPAGDDSAESPTLWFHTAHQTISARVIDAIAAGGTVSGSRFASFGTAQIADISLKIPGGGPVNYYQAVVTVLNAQTDVLPSGSLVYLTWVDDVVNGLSWQGWAVTKAKPIICSERLERFTMLSNWDGTNAAASFMLITAGSPDQYGLLEDPLGIFTDQIGYGNVGLAIRTCDGRHFVIQAKCNQTPVTPATLGMCLFGSPGSPTCANTTEANCTLLGGVWTSGVSCP